VQYELGGGYQFSDAMAAKVTLFWKDMYDYPTSIRLQLRERRTTRSNFFIYWNVDYARSRGIEISLLRKRVNYLSGSLSYTYSVGKGKSSDPNKTKLIQELGGDSRETELGEEFLWWNRPHKLTASLNLRVRDGQRPPRWLGLPWPGDFSLNLYFMIRSGRAYTPINILGVETGDRYSRNGPYDSTCDLSLRKGFHLGRRRLEASFNVYNLFDYRTPMNFDPVTGKPYEFGEGGLNLVTDNPANLDLSDQDLLDAYRRETGRVPGQSQTPSEFAQSIRRDIIASYYRYSDPSLYGAPRSYRLGISYEW
jgi:outer membrane receptor protein involved in Fe transport